MRANKDEPINRLRTSRSSNKRGHRQLLAALVLGGILESGDEQVLQSRGILSVPGIMVQRETHDAYTNPRIYSTIGYLDQATSPNIGVNFETVRNNYGEVGSTVQLRSVLPAQTFARLYRAFDTTNPEVQAMLANNRYFYLPNPPPTRARYIRGDNSGYDTVIVSSNALPFEALIRERLALASVGENGLTASDSILVDDLRHELLHDAWHHLLSSQDKEKFVHIMDQLFELQPECDALGRPLVLAYYLNNPSVAASHVGLPSGVFLGDSRWQPTYRRAVELIFSDVVSEFARNYSPQDATIRQHVTDLLLWYTRFRINMEQRFVTYTHLNRSSL